MKQGERSLEDHTRDYIFLAEHSHFPDSSLCTFYRAGLNTTTKGLLSGEGPRESLPDYIEWVLASCGSSWTIDFVKEDVSPTPDPEPSQPSPRQAELEPEPTADKEPEPRATEPEPDTSDQVREPDTTSAKVECCVEQERAMESPAHCTTAGGELEQNSGDLIDFSMEVLENDSGDLIDFFSEVSICSDLPVCMEFPPTLPLLPMSTYVCSPLSPDSPSAHPQPTTCAVGSPRVCQLPSASGLEDPSAPPPASESRTPPRPSDPAAPPRLSASSSPPSPVGPPAPPGSLVPPAPPWSVVVPPSPRDSTPPALPRRSIPPALLGSSLPLAQPPSSVAPAPPRTSGSPDLRLRLGRQSLGLRLGPPDPRCRPGSSALRLRLGLLRQLLRLCQSAPWSRQPFLHHGSSLHRLHRGSSWLRSGSPSASPALGPSCFLLGSFHLRQPPGLCYVDLNCLSGHCLLYRPPTLVFFFVFCTALVAPIRRGALCYIHVCLCLWFLPLSPPVDLSALVLSSLASSPSPVSNN
ncbi:Cell surface glycoprotein 1 [Labeo rohita]|uniref:Cell surface glycoprotein 1 n=1 Tax=Labeo rohita TaxID=84645 RepID=A0ABQ8LTV3_LABRO|nr:Cell surface glycoprotein 1 [Labeo rohita]